MFHCKKQMLHRCKVSKDNFFHEDILETKKKKIWKTRRDIVLQSSYPQTLKNTLKFREMRISTGQITQQDSW